MKIAIVGAGVAGLSVAARLDASGHTVHVFDKGRGPGGRLSTRRVQLNGAEISFDHGAQYFTARDADFERAVEAWIAEGVVAEWAPRMMPALRGPAYVGVAGMSSLVRHLAARHNVRWGAAAESIGGAPLSMELRFSDGTRAGPFDRVIVAVPAEQAAVLLASAAPDLARGARSVASSPCWAVMLALDAPAGITWDAEQSTDGPIAWSARNSSKPGRRAPETWVLHASPDWSQENLEAPPEIVADALTKVFRERTNGAVPSYTSAHRWRYARVERPLGHAFQYDPRLGIGTCGDWHIGARVEAAWQSGALLAAEMLR